MSVLLSLIPMAIDLISGLVSQSESDKTADQIREQQLDMPVEQRRAEALAKEMSYMGLPGYELYKQEIGEMLPTTMNQAREYAQSPSMLIEMASRGLAQTNKAYNDLAVRDASAKIGNMRNYQDVLGQSARMNLGVQQGNIQTNLSAIGQEAQGTKDLLQSFENAIGSGINTYSTLSGLNYQNEYLDMMKGFFGSDGTEFSPSVPGMAGYGDQPSMTNPFSPSVPGTAGYGDQMQGVSKEQLIAILNLMN